MHNCKIHPQMTASFSNIHLSHKQLLGQTTPGQRTTTCPDDCMQFKQLLESGKGSFKSNIAAETLRRDKIAEKQVGPNS